MAAWLAGRLITLCGVSWAQDEPAQKEPVSPPERQMEHAVDAPRLAAQHARGFQGIIHHGILLRRPSPLPEGSTNDVTYELGICFQLDKTHCLVVSSMDEAGGPDLCVGNDGFVFEKLSDIKAPKAIPVSRPEVGFKMKNGQTGYLAKFPVTGGFVPLGAVLPDRRPHPAAGTGLLVCLCRTYPSDRSDVGYAAPHDNTGENWKAYETFMEVTEYRWDGHELSLIHI